MKYKFWWDGANEVVRIAFSEQGQIASLTKAKEEFLALLEELPEKINVLADCRQVEGDAELELLKKINLERVHEDFAKRINNVAIFGLGLMQWMKLEVIINLGKFKRIRIFVNEGDALNWLKEEDKS